MMYEGVKNKTFISVSNEELFRGGIISNLEIENLKNYLNCNENEIKNNNEKLLPKAILYMKPFQSFTKKRKEAEKFMEDRGANIEENYSKFIFIIEKNENKMSEELFSNAYVKDYSAFPNEDEVLFFPFSTFAIKELREINDHFEIILEYLGKYKPVIEEIKPIENLLNDIPISKFGKDITQFGLIKYDFKSFWKVIKEIKINEGDASCLLYLGNNKILIAVNNILKVYDIDKEKNIKNFQIHQDEIKDLLKIDEKRFISSSKDKTISYNEFTPDLLNLNILKLIKIHEGEVNQTIKLQSINFYASCSNDKTIKIWEIKNNNYNIQKDLRGHETEVLSIYELKQNEMVSISKGGFFKFWENENCLKSLEISEIPLHNCISLLNKHIISLATNKSIILIDIIKKEKIKKYSLDSPSSSVLNFFGNLLFAQKNNEISFYLREYNIIEKNTELDIECIGKGKDNTIEIPYIQTISENEIVTSNKTKFVKIWERTGKKPEILQFDEFKKKIENKKIEEEKKFKKEQEIEKEKEKKKEIKEIEKKEEILEIYKKDFINSENIIISEQLKIIPFLLENCICSICKIGNYNKIKATGFFCKIPYQSKLLPVLITCNHILNSEDIVKNNNIEISINNNNDKKKIIIDKNRIIYSNEKLDMTFIEIIPNKDNINNFLEIDEYNHKDYYNYPIYILYYLYGEKMGMSSGFIKKVKDNNDIIYDAATSSVSGGAPIISIKNNKVIGIHIGTIKNGQNENKNMKIGLSIQGAFMEINNEIKKNSSLNNIPQIMNYDLNIKKLHIMISQYYGNENFIDIKNYSNVILEELTKNKILKIEGILKAINQNDNNKLIKEVLHNYKFLMKLNDWLMNSKKLNHNLLNSIAYFTSRIMYSLDLYASKNKQYFKDEKTIYRGLKMDYESLLLYQKSIGKIIIIPAFTSCVEIKEVAEMFSRGNDKSKFSVIFLIKFNHKINMISNGINVQEISEYQQEKEILIQAFSFFFVKIDNDKHFANIYLEIIGRKEILENEIKKGKDIEYNEKENIIQIKK